MRLVLPTLQWMESQSAVKPTDKAAVAEVGTEFLDKILADEKSMADWTEVISLLTDTDPVEIGALYYNDFYALFNVALQLVQPAGDGAPLAPNRRSRRSSAGHSTKA